MKIIEAIKKRRSIRSYLNKKVDRKIIAQLVALANLAPTADSKENRLFIAIDDRQIKTAIYKASFEQSHLKEAPVILAVCCRTDLFKPIPFIRGIIDWGVNFHGINEKNYSTKKIFTDNWPDWIKRWPIQDTDAATTIFCLTAQDLSLSTCWVGFFEQNKVKKLLKLPKNYQVVSLITLGYQKKGPYPQKRKSLMQLIRWNSY